VLYDSKAPINDVYDVVEFAVTINKIVAKVKQESDAAEESTVGNGTRIVEIGRTRYKVFYSRNEAGEIKLKDFEAVK
jgi:hypothetical protein